MAFSYVGEAPASSDALGTALSTPARAHGTGNHLFVHITWEEIGTTTAIITDTAGNDYEPCPVNQGGSQPNFGQWFYCFNATGHAENVVTVTLAAARTYRSIRVLEFSSPTAAFDKHVPASSSTTTSTSTPAFDTIGEGLILAGTSAWNGEVQTDFGANYTGLPSASQYSKEAYRITSDPLTGEVVTYTSSIASSRSLEVLSIVVGTPIAPGAPANVTATAGNASASVNFTAPSNGGSPITGYTVTSSPGGITATGTSSPINVTGLTNGVAYTFTVHATNSVGNSAESAASNSVTPAVPVPSASVTLVDTAGSPRASLTSLKWAWFDQITPDLFAAPTDKGTAESTDGSGVLTVSLPNTTKTSGQIGWLIVTDSDGTASMVHKCFSGPVAVA